MGNGPHLTTWGGEDGGEDMRDSEMPCGVDDHYEDEKTERERPDSSGEDQAKGQGEASESQEDPVEAVPPGDVKGNVHHMTQPWKGPGGDGFRPTFVTRPGLLLCPGWVGCHAV